MKIAVTSDLHGRKPNPAAREVISGCAALLLCGDVFEPFSNNSKLEKYLGGLTASGKKVVMVPGNHDFGVFFALHPEKREVYGGRLAGCKDYHPDWLREELGVECLVDSSTMLGDLLVWGTPYTPLFCGWAFMEKDGDELLERYMKMPENADIVLSHGPPKTGFSSIDVVIGREDEHLGSSALSAAILARTPKRLFCGHIHTGLHEDVEIGQTICRNVSYLDEQYVPVFPVYTMEI